MSFVAKSTPSSLRAPGPWEHRDISANGAQFHLVEAGPEDGQTLLLLHGFPEFWWTWRKHIPYLAELGYRVVAMDLRGFGASDKQPGGYSVVAIAHDVAAVIGCLGVEQVVVIGHGVGGAAAWITPLIVRKYQPWWRWRPPTRKACARCGGGCCQGRPGNTC